MGILAAIVTIGILVTVHEFGHFIVAKKTGMRVVEFAIGFGPAIWSCHRGETLYSLRCVPLGGYNKIAGMDTDEDDAPDGFNAKPLWAKFAVVVAGAAMNFILPVLIYAGGSCVQGVDTLVNKPVLGMVQQGGAGYVAGLREGDTIVSVNGIVLQTWDDVVTQVRDNGEKEMRLVVQREGKIQEYRLNPVMNKELGRAIIGVSPKFEMQPCGIFEAVGIGFGRTGRIMTMMTQGLYKIVTGNAPADLSGPVGVAMVAGQVAQKGVWALLNFVAFLSINLGIINLLPLPALDGGYVVLLCLERLRGKPLPAKAMEYIQYTGIGLIIAVTLFSTYKDFLRLGF